MRVLIILIFLSLTVVAQKPYTFGVFPHMPLKKLHSVFSVMTNDLQTQLDRPIRLMTKPYFSLYKEELDRGVYDFAFIQPLDYIEAHELQGYLPLARRAEDLTSIMVSLKTSNFNSLRDIKDKVIAFAPVEGAVTKMMLVSLEKEGYRAVDDFSLSYSKNHFVCLQKVLDKKAAACVTARQVVKYFNFEMKNDNFKVIYETQSLPHALFVAHPRVPLQTRNRVQERILTWNTNNNEDTAQKKGRWLNFVKAKDTDYDRVRHFLSTKVK